MPDDVIIKLRELVATTRFRHAWALLDQEDELHRHSGLEAIRRLVAARDCTMADLVRLMTAMPMPAQPHEKARAAAGYERTRAAASAAPSPSTHAPRHAADPDPMRGINPEGRQRFLEDAAQTLLSSLFIPFNGQRIHSGNAVARTLRGLIEVLGSRQTPFGEVIGFVLRNAEGAHGPIAAIDAASIERLRTAQEADARMNIQTIPAHGCLMHPSVTRVSVAMS